MSWLRGDDNATRAPRSAEERERARREREARRTGRELPPPEREAFPAPPPREESGPPPTPPLFEEVPSPDPAAAPRPPEPPSDDFVPPDWVEAAQAPPAQDDPPRHGVRHIAPDPPAPPAAPAGALRDETERPAGLRRVRRATAPRRAVVTPPGDVPGGPARARRSLRGHGSAVVAVLVAVLLVFIVATVFQPFAGEGGEPVRVTIPDGSGAGEIGDILADAGVVDSGFLFSIRAGVSRKRGDLRSGPHTLRRGMSYGAAIDALTGEAAVRLPRLLKVTLPEGPSRRELNAVVARAGVRGDYVRASRRFSGALDPSRYRAPSGTRSLEGFLFPATYELKAGENARDLVEQQLRAFRSRFARVSLRRARRKNLSAYDVLIIASMVEREAQLARERPLIAAVIYNRLAEGMPLGIDATIRYATNNWDRPLRRSELELNSRYNTRKRTGLPPTPIGNPGLSAIRAAARPANVKHLYYVVKPGTCGQHEFSSSFAEFQRDAARYDSARARRNGRSPTNC